MKLKNPGAELFVPDGASVEEALRRTTLMGIGAHQDDLEIMAYPGILQAFGREDQWFAGVTVTDGSGSPRDGLYADYSDQDMQKIRQREQKKAAVVGEYSFQALLDYPSKVVKDPACEEVQAELKALIEAANPAVIYTHNLADKHDTHVAVALRTIQALRELPADKQPQALYGCEVWRDLDWMVDQDKVAFDVAAHENLAAALVSVFDSQVCGGNRYDLATLGRRRAHATYHSSHETQTTAALIFAMDLTPLIRDPGLEIGTYVDGYIQRFATEVADRLARLEKRTGG